MEEVLLRFNHIGKQIFARLSNDELTKCREAGSFFKNFIDEENLPWNRIVVQKFACQNGETPLHLAAKTGQIQQFKSISEDLNDKNPTMNGGYTPLYHAAEKGHLEICQLIIESVKDKNPKNINEITPLHIAARNGHEEVCKMNGSS